MDQEGKECGDQQKGGQLDHFQREFQGGSGVAIRDFFLLKKSVKKVKFSYLNQLGFTYIWVGCEAIFWTFSISFG